MEWVAKITTVGLIMILPAVAGAYLDRWLGTGYWAPLGVVVGFVAGLWHLLQITRPPSKASPSNADGSKRDSERNNGDSAAR